MQTSRNARLMGIYNTTATKYPQTKSVLMFHIHSRLFSLALSFSRLIIYKNKVHRAQNARGFWSLMPGTNERIPRRLLVCSFLRVCVCVCFRSCPRVKKWPRMIDAIVIVVIVIARRKIMVVDVPVLSSSSAISLPTIFEPIANLGGC